MKAMQYMLLTCFFSGSCLMMTTVSSHIRLYITKRYCYYSFLSVIMPCIQSTHDERVYSHCLIRAFCVWK
ncbi:hypothetical protein BDW42DRAFT_177937 [Aspergillus taichungensis]|uniref:Uncharacterized protein n=1 Tax=Aspergillus taichungensis TaxID=482145 RepID=A0A2J5HIR0_9EURO|nr:hypothetical protein BDW42DRAFT_177937 [Aspergillus taichungensis]